MVPVIKTMLLREGIVVTLTAEPAVLAERVGKGEGRPLLGDDDRALFLLRQGLEGFGRCVTAVRNTRVGAEDEHLGAVHRSPDAHPGCRRHRLGRLDRDRAAPRAAGDGRLGRLSLGL